MHQVILTAFVLVWSAPFFKKLFQPGGALESLVIKLPIPNTVSDLSPKGIALRLDLIGATGTAILLTVNYCNFNYEVKMEKCRCFIGRSN